jgi:hypothetical protein
MDELLRAGVRWIDHLLSKSQGITPISQDPDCILRIQLGRSSHIVTLSNEIILRGDPILALHMDNEHMPGLPHAGANLDWALKLRRQVVYSFRQVAKVIRPDGRYAYVRAIYGASTLFSFTDHIGGLRMMQHLGFTVLPYHRPFGRFGEFWENLFSWWLMWTYNQPSLHNRQFSNLQRTEIWMLADEFIARYGEAAVA